MLSHYPCPIAAVFDRNLEPHWEAYGPALSSPELAAFSAVAALIKRWATATDPSVHAPVLERLRAAQQAFNWLSEPASRGATARQLAQLAAEQTQGQPRLSLHQLQMVCLRALKERVGDMIDGVQAHGPRLTHPEAIAAATAAIAAFVQLEPDSPASIYNGQITRHLVQPPCLEADIQQLLRGLELAQAQRRDYWVVRIASKAVRLVMCGIEAGPACGLQIETISRSEGEPC